MSSIRNPYFPALPNTWQQKQKFYESVYYYSAANINSSDIANALKINTPNYGTTVVNAHSGVANISGFSADLFGIYSTYNTSQIFLLDKSFNAAIYGILHASAGKSTYVDCGVVPTTITPSIASGTVYQNTTHSYQTLTLPFYASTAGTAGTVTINMGTSSTPGAWTTVYVSGGTSSTATTNYTLRVPPQWYYEVVVSGTTIGTVNGVQE